jgi:hypothetical protein
LLIWIFTVLVLESLVNQLLLADLASFVISTLNDVDYLAMLEELFV